MFFYSAVCNQHMMHEPNKAFQIMWGLCPGGICPGGMCPGECVLGGICPGVSVRGGGGGVVLSPCIAHMTHMVCKSF